MQITKNRASKLLLAIVLAVAMVFSMIPLLPGGQSYADPEPTVLTVQFREGAQSGVGGTITPPKEYTQTELNALAETTEAKGYIAYESTGTKYVTYTTKNYIEIVNLLKDASGNPEFAFKSGIQLYLGSNTKATYSYQDVANGYFPGATTATAAENTESAPADRVPLVLALTGEKADIATDTTAADNVSGYPVDGANPLSGFTLLAGLLSNNTASTYDAYAKANATYGNEAGRRRISTGVTKIIVDIPGPLSSFGVYSTLGTSSKSGLAMLEDYTLAKQYNSRSELEAIKTSGTLNYLWGSKLQGWSLATVNEYVSLKDILKDAGIVFSSGDSLQVIGGDGYAPAPLEYADIQNKKWFYPATTAGGSDAASPESAPPIISLNRVELRLQGGDPAASFIGQYADWTNHADKSGRFLIGAAESDYTAASPNVGGSPLVSFLADFAILKGAQDDISNATVTLPASSFTATGEAITPKVTAAYVGVEDTYNDITLAEGRDYTVEYTNNTAVGTATITLTGKGNFTGTKTATFAIIPPSISDASVAAVADQTYTGKAITPEPAVTYGGKTLVKETDYTLSYSNNTKAGEATIIITGKGKYIGTKTVKFTIAPRAISEAKVAAIAAKTYTGKAITPKPAVKYDGKTLVKETDYTLSYSKNIKAGTATIKITGKGNFSGTKTVTFKIKYEGWVKQANGTKKYYKNNVAVTAWQNISSKRYYFSKNGIMQTGWTNIKDKKGKTHRYYFASNGIMKSGWTNIKDKKGKTHRYYFGSANDGKMRIGWKNIGKHRYYFGGANDGKMRTGKVKIGGKTYIFAKDGRLLR